MVLAALEFVAVLGLGARMAMNVPWDYAPGYVWFIGTMLLGMAAVASFVLRSAALMQQARAGADVHEARGKVFAGSVLVAVGALLLSAAGPGTVARLFEAVGVPVGNPTTMAGQGEARGQPRLQQRDAGDQPLR